MNHSVSIGERLREERLRLGLSQPAFGEISGVTKKTQMLYEGGERNPDSAYLAAIAAAGADVLYVLTGQHVGGAKPAPTLSADEEELLALFRAAPLAVKAAAIGALHGAAAAPRAAKPRVARRADPGGMSMTNSGPDAVQVSSGGGAVTIKKGR